MAYIVISHFPGHQSLGKSQTSLDHTLLEPKDRLGKVVNLKGVNFSTEDASLHHFVNTSQLDWEKLLRGCTGLICTHGFGQKTSSLPKQTTTILWAMPKDCNSGFSIFDQNASVRPVDSEGW